MANYAFLDAFASVKTAASSTIGGVEYQIIKIPDTVSVSVVGAVPVNFSGSPSVNAAQAGTWSPSAIGYAYRNDTLASTLGADQSFGPMARDSAGRLVIKPFVADDSASFQYNGSVVSTSVTLIQASAIGKRSYITDFWFSNTGSVVTIVQFKDGSTSFVGQGVAPAGGGESSPGIALPLKTSVSQDLTFQALSAASVLYVTVKGYQAP